MSTTALVAGKPFPKTERNKMDPLLEELAKNGRETAANLAKMLDTTPEDVESRIAAYEKSGVIRGFRAMLNPNKVETSDVRAAIELKIRPERETGFGEIAARVARFPQVASCFLMSGGYDLLLFVKGKSLQDVAHFVSAELSTIDGVLSSATHFMLKTYKDHGVSMEGGDNGDERLSVTP